MKILKVPAETTIPGLRPMLKKDVPAVHNILSAYLTKSALHIEFSLEEVEHFLLPREGVIEAYVVQEPSTKEITDFISFYELPSSVLKHVEHKLLRAAYSYYNVANKHSLTELMREALVLAKQKGFDVFNALDIMQNEEFLKELKFGIGDGHLHYYLYNWRVPDLEPRDIGIVLV
jgi:glycylpeptide N-tetradecanoyltransferase